MRNVGRGTPRLIVADGERAKTPRTVGRVYDGLIDAGADRGAIVVALGGGVLGDLVGFAAATYLRGVRLVQVPTTLMAQVDSAIGGKVGVNHPRGKNLIGAFHPPRLVLVDPEALATLPPREFRAGLYEVIKYGVIADARVARPARRRLDAVLTQRGDALAEMVTTCCRIKAGVVSSDEREGGLRRILNFGHTAGHALEAAAGYRRLRHGEAVGLRHARRPGPGRRARRHPARGRRPGRRADRSARAAAAGGRPAPRRRARRDRPRQEGRRSHAALHRRDRPAAPPPRSPTCPGAS